MNLSEQEEVAVRTEIGQTCKAKRKELGLTQKQVADQTGFDVKTINKFENGRFWVGLRQYIAIKKALQLPLN